MTNINVSIPEKLHKQFKLKLLKEEKLLKDIIVELIKNYLGRKK